MHSKVEVIHIIQVPTAPVAISNICPVLVMATKVIPPKHCQHCIGSRGNIKKPAVRGRPLPATVLMTQSPASWHMYCMHGPTTLMPAPTATFTRHAPTFGRHCKDSVLICSTVPGSRQKLQVPN